MDKRKLAKELVKLAKELVSRKPSKKEEVYSEFDKDSGMYVVFGVDSGFGYESYSSEREAEKEAKKMNKRNGFK